MKELTTVFFLFISVLSASSQSSQKIEIRKVGLYQKEYIQLCLDESLYAPELIIPNKLNVGKSINPKGKKGSIIVLDSFWEKGCLHLLNDSDEEEILDLIETITILERSQVQSLLKMKRQ